MAAFPPPSARQRARPGSLERPVNGRLYRGTWLLVGIPLLIAAFSVAKPQALRPAEPALPATFDSHAAAALAASLARDHPDRSPGSTGLAGAEQWFADQLAPYGFRVERQPFTAAIPGRAQASLRNLVAVVPGHAPQAIAVMAHLDNAGTGPGANDNASGIGAMIELARSYSSTSGLGSGGAQPISPAHTILFVASEAGAFGGIGADRFARSYRNRVLAVLDLSGLAGQGRPRLLFNGNTPRSPNAAFVETAAARISEQLGTRPSRSSGLAQLIDLAFPFTLYEHGPLIARGLPALTLTSGGARPPASFTDTPERLNVGRLGELGRAAQQLLRTLDQGVELVAGTSSYVYLGPRVVRGWAIELVLLAALLPFLIGAVDLFARCRRRHIALAPALRSYRSRLYFWLWTGALFELFALIGIWPRGAALPLSPESSAAGDWPVLGLAGLAFLSAVGWLVARERLQPRRLVTAEEQLAGHAAALLALGFVALLVVATNPFALVLLLPSVHAWLWLPQVRERRAWVRAAVLAAGLAGPLLLIGSFAFRFGLGFDAPWYILELAAVHFVGLPTGVIVLGWAAAAAQLAALAAGRYAPYPTATERPTLGPVRATVKRVVLATRARRRASEPARKALGG